MWKVCTSGKKLFDLLNLGIIVKSIFFDFQAFVQNLILVTHPGGMFLSFCIM